MTLPNDSPSNDCPECAKVILNGGISARVLDETCSTIYNHLETGGEFKNVKDLVKRANQIEDLVFEFSRAVLEGVGFKGPWPRSLRKDGE